MTGAEMIETVQTGLCPNCRGPLTNVSKLDLDEVLEVGGCDACNINWVAFGGNNPRMEAVPKWPQM